jgi:hypothetical protein
MDISNIEWHDTKIYRVIEDTEAKTLTMEVSYPVDWENNLFEKRLLVFEKAHHYQVVEDVHCAGSPTILDANVIGTDGQFTKLRLETTNGYRELSCVAVRVSE